MHKDAFGQGITTDAPLGVAAFDSYVDGQLSYGPHVADIFQAIEADPEAPLFLAHGAAVHMSLEAKDGMEAAWPLIEKAQERMDAALPRERLAVEWVASWYRNDMARAIALLDELTDSFPEDISAAKWGQYHCFNLGDTSGMLRFALKAAKAHEQSTYCLDMQAFALEESNRLEEAEELARQAIAIKSDNAWAHHAVAHVMETQGRVEEGLAWMSGHSASWDKAGVFIREHNWWHIGLFLSDLERYDEALALYDDHLFGEWPEFGQEQIGAVSALWRLELRGIDVGKRWEPVSRKILERGFEHIQPFHDMHYLYGLLRDGHRDHANRFIGSMEQHALAQHGQLKQIWRDRALPLASGLKAFSEGRWDDAERRISSVLPFLPEIGGSHAQRDIFALTCLEAMIRNGSRAAAVAMARKRHDDRPHVVWTRKQLARAKAL